MQLDRLIRKLEGLAKATVNGHLIKDLYNLLYVPEIWYSAYAKIYSNKGAMTEGVDSDTLDGMSHQRIEKIINALKEGRYRCKPVKRVYIPKPNGKLRPLGLPSGDDKMVQQVCKMILEQIYEPIFSDKSHGFRPNRSCHTALQQISRSGSGTKWFIEFDIQGFFDNMDHDVLIGLLEQKISDPRFLKLIKGMLKAGYCEDWVYHKTYSGTPQGGIISPILSNIYLHALDTHVETLITEFNKGSLRPPNPEYRRLTHLKSRLRKKMRSEGKTEELMEKLAEADKRQKRLPSGDQFSEKFKRLRYCRYADDFILGVIGSNNEARAIQRKVTTFLNDELKLQIAEEKTGIASAKDGIQFLNYSIRTWRGSKTLKRKHNGTYSTRRTVNESISLQVPLQRVIAFSRKRGYGDWEKTKPTHRNQLLNASDEEIILTYNSELRGFANYYALAYDVKSKLNKLQYLANYSLFKTLANRHKCKKAKILERLKVGNEYIHKYTLSGQLREMKVFRLKHLEIQKVSFSNLDSIAEVHHLTLSKNELINRLEANRCEYCGKETPTCQVHHVRKLSNLKKKPKPWLWEKIMIARNRKTLILCAGTPESCHELLHAGKLPDNRYFAT